MLAWVTESNIPESKVCPDCDETPIVNLAAGNASREIDVVGRMDEPIRYRLTVSNIDRIVDFDATEFV